MPAANSTPRSTRPRAACTASASRSSTRCRNGSKSRSRAAASSTARPFERGKPKGGLEKLGKVAEPARHHGALQARPADFRRQGEVQPAAPVQDGARQGLSVRRRRDPLDCDKALLAGIDDVPAEATFHFPGGLKDYLAAAIDGAHAGASGHLHRRVGQARRQRRGRMGGRLGRRRRRLRVLLLQHHPDRGRRHP